MRNKIVAALLAVVTLLSCGQAPAPFLAEHAQLDLLITNATVYDGIGSEPFAADVVVDDGVIVYVGRHGFSPAELGQRVIRKIDAAGRVLAPGFIDLHAHGDPLQTPQFENFLAMGVTTITLGQDGDSPAVDDLSAWLDEVAARGIGPNLAMFVGHGTLRNQAGIGTQATPDAADLQAMLAALERTLGYTFGLSTGLEYNPGLHAAAPELQALAQVVGRHGRLIMSHLRSEDDEQLEASIAELLDQGQYARVHISHLKSVYGKGAARAAELLAILERARAAGIDITADVYPYSASYAGISLLFPVWAKTAEQFAVARTTRREELRAYLRQRILLRNGPEATLLGTEPYTGKTLAEVSFELELPFEDVLIDVIGPQGASAAYFVMNDALQSRLLASPLVGVCSDGSPSGWHPRGHGAFAKIIQKYVVAEKVLTLGEAIVKMTSFPATLLGIRDRGAIRAGMRADLLIFDPARVRENASYPAPHQLAEGFDVVIVNGRVAREDGRVSDALSGLVLTPD
ncbi:MAG: amidohydrolase family protein [Gammaproteobacteria bacterium]|nr:MAG: amidohydrolase family protein [Gammaproteobacteria bacterium]